MSMHRDYYTMIDVRSTQMSPSALNNMTSSVYEEISRILQEQQPSQSPVATNSTSNDTNSETLANWLPFFVALYLGLTLLFLVCYSFSSRRNRELQLERQRIEDAKYIEDPDHRRKRIQRYFHTCKCRMVVKEGDVIIGDIPVSTRRNDSSERNTVAEDKPTSTGSDNFCSAQTTQKVSPVSTPDIGSHDHPDDDLDIEACNSSCPPPCILEEVEEREKSSVKIDEHELLRESGSLVLGGIKYFNNSIELKNNRRGTTVVNCCAICLCPYELSDVVVWSDHESDCRHAFHEQCMLDWMCAQQQLPVPQRNTLDDDISRGHKRLPNRHTPCPMCRHAFIPSLHQYYGGKYIKKESHITNPRTFNLDAITIR